MSDVTTGSVLQLNLENYAAEEGWLYLYVNHNQGEELSLAADAFSVSLGKEELEIVNVQTVGETGIPVTFLCLVDVSGSLDQKRMDTMKETLGCLVENMREGDSICIIAMGDELHSTGFLTDKEEIQAQIDALEVLHEDTNLYQGIEESLLLLQTDTDVSAKRCLVVFSDGAEDNPVGITREEVNTQVQESHIPVFTVGMIKNPQNQSQLDSAKILGSFARISAGGSHYVPALDEMSAEQMADEIWTSMLAGQVITADTGGLSPTGQELYLQVSVKVDGIGAASTGMNVPDGNMLFETDSDNEEETGAAEETGAEKETAGTESTESAETETGSLQKEPESGAEGINLPLFAAIGIGVVLLLAILAAVFFKKKKKEKKKAAEMAENRYPEEKTEGETEEEAEGETEGETEGKTEGEAPSDSIKGREETAVPIPAAPPQGETLTIQLIRMGINESKSFSLSVEGSLTMGRNPQTAAFALPEDKSLSGLHCTFYVRDGRLFLEDNGSTNGTYVNGVPIKSAIRLNRDDVLLIGSYEYRILW